MIRMTKFNQLRWSLLIFLIALGGCAITGGTLHGNVAVPNLSEISN